MNLEDSERRRITRRQKGSKTQSIIQTGEFVGTDPSTQLPIFQAIDGSRSRGRSITNQPFEIGDPIQITSVRGGQLSRMDRIPGVRDRQQLSPFLQGDPFIADRRRGFNEPFGCYILRAQDAQEFEIGAFDLVTDMGSPALTNLQSFLRPFPSTFFVTPVCATWGNPVEVNPNVPYRVSFRLTYRSDVVNQYVWGLVYSPITNSSFFFTPFGANGIIQDSGSYTTISSLPVDPGSSLRADWGPNPLVGLVLSGDFGITTTASLPNLFIRSLEFCYVEP